MRHRRDTALDEDLIPAAASIAIARRPRPWDQRMTVSRAARLTHHYSHRHLRTLMARLTRELLSTALTVDKVFGIGARIRLEHHRNPWLSGIRHRHYSVL